MRVRAPVEEDMGQKQRQPRILQVSTEAPTVVIRFHAVCFWAWFLLRKPQAQKAGGTYKVARGRERASTCTESIAQRTKLIIGHIINIHQDKGDSKSLFVGMRHAGQCSCPLH